MMNTEDIPNPPDRAQRFEEIMVDCADEYENLSAFEVYLTDALRFPFAATRGQGKSARPVTVLGLDGQADTDDVRLRVRQANGKEHSVPGVTRTCRWLMRLGEVGFLRVPPQLEWHRGADGAADDESANRLPSRHSGARPAD